jgi:hypothetical protein
MIPSSLESFLNNLFLVTELKEFKPSILLEFDDKNTTQFGYKRDDIVELLKTYGYSNFQLFAASDLYASTL